MRSPAGPCLNVVAKWIGGAIAPVVASGSAPAWTNKVSGCMAGLFECPVRRFERVGDVAFAVCGRHKAGLERRGCKVNAALEHRVEETIEHGDIASCRLS